MYEVKIVDRKKIKKKRERVNKTARVRASIWNRNMSAVQWIVHFFRFFWVCVYHSTTKQFSHWNWYTKRTIHNSVCTALGCVCVQCVLMCGVFVSLFFLHIVIIQKVSAHEWTDTNTRIVFTDECERTHTHTRIHARASTYISRRTCFAGHELSMYFWIGRTIGVYWITTTTTTTKAGRQIQ